MDTAMATLFGGVGVLFIGAIVNVSRRLYKAIRRSHDIEDAVLGEPARQGVSAKPSLREQFDVVTQAITLLTNKMEQLASRPVMNGAFQELTERVKTLVDHSQEADRRFDQIESRIVDHNLKIQGHIQGLVDQFHSENGE